MIKYVVAIITLLIALFVISRMRSDFLFYATSLPFIAVELIQVYYLLINKTPRVPARGFWEILYPGLVVIWTVVATVLVHPRIAPIQGAELAILRTFPILWMFWALIVLRYNFSVSAESRDLVTHGPYRWVRHPIYSGYIATWIIQAIFFDQPYYWAVTALSTIMLVVRASVEDRKLARDFPERRVINERVGMLFPRL